MYTTFLAFKQKYMYKSVVFFSFLEVIKIFYFYVLSYLDILLISESGMIFCLGQPECLLYS